MNRKLLGKASLVERPPTCGGVCAKETLQTFDRQSVFNFGTGDTQETCKAKEVDAEPHQD